MADALTAFLVDQLGSVIKQEIEHEVRLVVGVRKEVEKLKRTFKVIQTVLNDAEQRQMNEESVKVWLEDFKNVAYDIEDVLDEWRMEILSSQIEGLDDDDDDDDGSKQIMKKKVSSCLCSPFSCFNKIALRHDIGSRIKELRERLDYIETEKGKYQFIPSDHRSVNIVERPITSSIIVDLDIFGRDSDKTIILNKLLGVESSSNSTDPRLISIIGMGGLGKTTVARVVFNDNQVKSHFQKTMWVCVSQPFDLSRIAKAIIHEAGETPPDSPEWNALHKKLCVSVRRKHFLLVLDDVWTEDPNNLNHLKKLLDEGAHGSRILVTTRNEGVAQMMDCYKHFLGGLSTDDCLSVLRRKAFVGRKKEEISDVLKEISIEIAKKCGGLPLAAKILGSLLSKKKTEQDWRRVLESTIWDLRGFDNNKKLLNPALLLSYDDLPSPLKRCFAYCAIFPEDHEIKKDELIKMWMAQGILNSTTETEELELELIGEDYFNELAELSFFQDFSRDDDDDGSIIYCKMHDLVHDFAQFLTKNECYVKHNSDTVVLFNHLGIARHLTLIYDKDDEVEPSSFHSSLNKVEKLRTLNVFSNYNTWKSSLRDGLSDVFHHLRCLRVLNLKGMGITHLPNEIEKLIHLRYLDLSWNDDLMELPDSISSLYNLQTLNLESCSSLRKLPKGMSRMIHLRHLNIRWTNNLEYLPKGIGRLKSLQTLTKFVVGGGASGGECQIRELQNLNFLQGYIKITGLGRLKTEDEASKAELQKKQRLSGLLLDFNPSDAMASRSGRIGEINLEELGVDDQRMERVLGVLQPHPNLKELTIQNYLGLKFPSWMASNTALSHLRSLVLDKCSNCTELPALGLLPSLDILYIFEAGEVTHISREFYGIGSGRVNNLTAFLKLTELYIYNMPKLEELDLGVVAEEEEEGNKVNKVKAAAGSRDNTIIIMPCLTLLEIRRCSKLKRLRVLTKLPSLQTLSLRDCSSLSQLPISPNLTTLEIQNSTVLPQGIAQLKELQCLDLFGIDNLTCIPEYVQNLTKLQQLTIEGCPDQLTQRCRKDEGEDWNIISHIPNININGEKIQIQQR